MFLRPLEGDADGTINGHCGLTARELNVMGTASPGLLRCHHRERVCDAVEVGSILKAVLPGLFLWEVVVIVV